MSALRKEERYTYADYKTWGDDTRVELIDGYIYNMAAPSQRHQALSFEISALFRNYLKGKPCRAFSAPADVRLNYNKGDDTVLQPDMFVVCDKNKLDGQNCNGAPDLVLEILSPATSGKDKVIKFNKYLDAGVKEYWIVSPEEQNITVYTLESGKYTATPYAVTEETPNPMVTTSLFDDFVVDLVDVFSEMDI